MIYLTDSNKQGVSSKENWELTNRNNNKTDNRGSTQHHGNKTNINTESK